MDPRYTIIVARPQDIAALGAIEQAAAELFRGHESLPDPEDVFAESEFLEAQEAGRLWVALCGDTPVGFALIEMLASDLPHLEEIDVHPAHGQRGVGARLVRAVCAWAASSGNPRLTLTTYRNVPWNMPFYARLGFVEVAVADCRPELAALVRAETARGFDPERRLVMSHEVP